MIWVSSENQFVDIKKVDKIFKNFFENPHPPREIPRSAPAQNLNDFLFFQRFLLCFFEDVLNAKD